MSTLTIDIPETLKAKVAAAARKEGKTQSRFAREALEARLRKEPKKFPPGKSFYDLTKHLCGSVAGPADLSTNKKYMAGYGE